MSARCRRAERQRKSNARRSRRAKVQEPELRYRNGTWPGVTDVTGCVTMRQPKKADNGKVLMVTPFEPVDAIANAMDVGTDLHAIAEDVALSRPWRKIPQMGTALWFAALGLKEFIEDHRPQAMKVEEPMEHEKLRVGGTADLIANVDGVLELIDYKTTAQTAPISPSSPLYFKYMLQMAAYMGLCRECLGIEIQRVRLVFLCKREQTPRRHWCVVKTPEELRAYWPLFRTACTAWWQLNEIKEALDGQAA